MAQLLAWERYRFVPRLNESLSIYLHIPFCGVRCTYCAFNTYTDLEQLIPVYVAALCREATLVAGRNPHQSVHSIYFGGGTPSLLSAQHFQMILDQLARLFPLAADCEISLEANPDNLTAAYLGDLRRAGMNRLSIGMQSADAGILRMFDRQHDLAAVADAMRYARQSRFDNINLDVIFGSPGETFASWQVTVETVLHFAPEHISMYGLELKGGTALRQRVDAGALPRPDDDLFADMYEYASDRLEAGGYDQYEISNWCVADRECRHNLQYWRNLPYVGLGAGAHGFAGDKRYVNIAAPERYIASLSGGCPQTTVFPLTPAVARSSPVEWEDDLYETIMMGLRLTRAGIERSRFKARFGRDFADMFSPSVEKLASLGLLVVASDCVRLSRAGRLLSNAVIREFVEAIKPPD